MILRPLPSPYGPNAASAGGPLPLGPSQGVCGQCAGVCAGVERSADGERPSVGVATEALAQAARALQTTFLCTLGFVAEEQGVEPMPGERREGFDVEARARLMADHPLAAEAGPALFGDYDEQFEEGLALILAGIESRYGMN